MKREISMYVIQLIRIPEINEKFIFLVKEMDRYELMVGCGSTEEELEKQSLVVTASIVTINLTLNGGVVAKYKSQIKNNESNRRIIEKIVTDTVVNERRLLLNYLDNHKEPEPLEGIKDAGDRIRRDILVKLANENRVLKEMKKVRPSAEPVLVEQEKLVWELVLDYSQRLRTAAILNGGDIDDCANEMDEVIIKDKIAEDEALRATTQRRNIIKI